VVIEELVYILGQDSTAGAEPALSTYRETRLKLGMGIVSRFRHPSLLSSLLINRYKWFTTITPDLSIIRKNIFTFMNKVETTLISKLIVAIIMIILKILCWSLILYWNFYIGILLLIATTPVNKID
jgi:hypothetical protein